MGKQASILLGGRIDISSMEADLAFFEARLSLAGDAPDTVYQLAQIKTYETLGLLISDNLKTLRGKQRQRERPRAPGDRTPKTPK